MTSYPLLFSCLIALWTGAPDSPPGLDSGAIDVADCGLSNSAFLPGEEIVYKIYYNLSPLWVSAGEVSFKVEDAGDKYRFKVVGFSYSSLEWFYKGIYTFESDVSKTDLMPQKFIRTIQEKKFSEYDKFVFDQNKGLVTTWQGKTAGEAKQETVQIAPCMHDMISVMYYLRNLDFDRIETGKSVPVKIFLEETYPLNVRVIAKNSERRVRGLGKHKVHIFSPEVIQGEVFSEGTQMTVWVSADENKIPLMIESPVRVGKVKAVLQKHKGLRHTFQACE